MSYESSYEALTPDAISVADAIRSKAGVSSSLVWPGGFVDAIQGITFPLANGEEFGDGQPDEIRITQLPTKTVYTDGEDIDLTGIVVKAYAEGEELYTVPVNQLTTNPTKASLVNAHATSDYIPQEVYFNESGYLRKYNNDGELAGQVFEGGTVSFVVADASDPNMVYAVNASPTPFVLETWDVWNDGTKHDERSYWHEGPYTIDGKDVHHSEWNVTKGAKWDATVNDSALSNLIEQAAWTALYGDIEGEQDITVMWNRPYDGVILTDTFDITFNS